MGGRAVTMIMMLSTSLEARGQQPPLVCNSLFQEPTFMRVIGVWEQQNRPTYDQTYCDQLHAVVCWKNQTDTWACPGYPPYLMQSSSGLFKGVGISFDVYKTETCSNSTYYRWPYDSGDTALFVPRSLLSSSGGVIITSYFEGNAMGEASFFIERYKLVLQYPWFSVMNASGVDCSQKTFLVHVPQVASSVPQVTSSPSLPPQQPLVCVDIYKYLDSSTLTSSSTDIDQRYCDTLYGAVCQRPDFQEYTTGAPGFPFYMLRNDAGRFKGNGVAFDVYGTLDSANKTYQLFPWDYSFPRKYVNLSTLLKNGALRITKSYAAGSFYSVFYYAPSSIVLLNFHSSFVMEQPALMQRMLMDFDTVRDTSRVNCLVRFIVSPQGTSQMLMPATTTPTPAKNSTSTQQSSSSNAKGNSVMLGVILGTGTGCAVLGWAMYIYCSRHVWTRAHHHFQHLSVMEG